jgi:glycosyltransferase 2 family protein
VGCEVGAGPFVAAMPVIDGLSAIPVSVSGLGVREKLFEVLLADLADVPKAVAVSASLTGFLLHVCWALVGGVLFLLHKGDVTVREIRESHV